MTRPRHTDDPDWYRDEREHPVRSDLRTEIIDGEPWTEHPDTLWCRECERWTHPAVETMGDDDHRAAPRCWSCGEHYYCDECGAEVDATGGCLSETPHAE